MAEQGGFATIGPSPVIGARFIGVGSKPTEVPAPLTDLPPGLIWAELCDLIARWQDPNRGYSSRMAVKRAAFPGDFDHLARFGEWDLSTKVTPEDIR